MEQIFIEGPQHVSVLIEVLKVDNFTCLWLELFSVSKWYLFCANLGLIMVT